MEYNINIVENIKLSLDLTLDSFSQIEKDNNDIKSYKLAIINLHSSLELTFKFMIMNRNEFMLFTLSGNNFENILQKYKKANQENCYSLLDYYEKNVFEEQPHTITFKTAYQILAYLYHMKEFDRRFIFQLEELERLRNKLTHFGATIKKTDLIIINELFEKCVELFNSELEEPSFKLSIEMWNKNYTPYDKYTYEKRVMHSDIINDIIKNTLLDDPICKLILEVILRESGQMNELKIDEYDKLCNICYDASKKEFMEYCDSKKEKEIKNMILEKIYLLVAGGIIYEKDITVDDYGTAFLMELSLREHLKDIIEKKWSNTDIECDPLGVRLSNLIVKYRNIYEDDSDY